MLIQSLYLRNFRCYEEAFASFGPNVNLIVGENASGKTSLLEAIYFLSTGRSFRTTHLTDLIAHGASFFYLEASFLKDGVQQSLKVFFDGKARKLQLNQKSYSSFIPLLGAAPTILFAPEHLSIVSGPPAERRNFLDLHIAQTDPLYLHHLLRYSKALRHRNTLLRQKSDETLSTWEAMMSSSASYLIPKRMAIVSELEQLATQHMRTFSDDHETLEMAYQSTLSLPKAEEEIISHFCAQFKKMRHREMALGNTLIGPHRDDLILTIAQQPARIFSSEGQKCCCLASLRFAEWERLQKCIHSPPVMSIDDFGMHLDMKRLDKLQGQLQALSQVFLTAPMLALPLPSQTIHVAGGRITPNSLEKRSPEENTLDQSAFLAFSEKTDQ